MPLSHAPPNTKQEVEIASIGGSQVLVVGKHHGGDGTVAATTATLFGHHVHCQLRLQLQLQGNSNSSTEDEGADADIVVPCIAAGFGVATRQLLDVGSTRFVASRTPGMLGCHASQAQDGDDPADDPAGDPTGDPAAVADDDDDDEGSYEGAIVLVRRGGCTFMEKVQHAQARGAVGVVVLNSEAASSGGATFMVMAGGAEAESAQCVPAVLVAGDHEEVLLGHARSALDGSDAGHVRLVTVDARPRLHARCGHASGCRSSSAASRQPIPPPPTSAPSLAVYASPDTIEVHGEAWACIISVVGTERQVMLVPSWRWFAAQAQAMAYAQRTRCPALPFGRLFSQCAQGEQ